MARAQPIREIFLPFVLLTAALLAACASDPCRTSARSGRGADRIDPAVALPLDPVPMLRLDGGLLRERTVSPYREVTLLVAEDCEAAPGMLAEARGESDAPGGGPAGLRPAAISGASGEDLPPGAGRGRFRPGV